MDEAILRIEDLFEKKARGDRMSRQVKEFQVLRKKQTLIGIEKGLKDTFANMMEVADSPLSVLINGETGTGKEIFARTIHDISGRRGKPFIIINCASLPDTLVESELFGYVKGAFTGATKTKPGKIEMADKGTLFLDEIGDISLNMQVKLLRVLEQVERLGDLHPIPVDFRLVCATHRNLETRIKEELFRQDFYYRIKQSNIVIPPLRERRQDIPDLVAYFIDEYLSLSDSRLESKPDISAAALDELVSRDWPGNARELKVVIELALTRLVATGGDTIDVRHLESDGNGKRESQVIFLGKLPGHDDLKKYLYREALKRADNNAEEAAKLLGIKLSTFYQALKKYLIALDDRD